MRTARLLPVSPSMHCSGGCTLSGGVPGPGGCTLSGGVPGPGVYLVGGVYLVPGRCTCPGVYLDRGCTCPGTLPPVDRQTRVKTTFANFVCGL